MTRRTLIFLLLLAGHLVVAGVLYFDVFTSEALEIAFQWAMVVVAGAWAWLILRAYARTGWGSRYRGFDRIFRASLWAVPASALVLFALIVTVPCQAHEVERYVRALLSSVSVYLFANAAIVFVLIALPYVISGRLWTSVWIGLVVAALLHAIHVAKYLILQQHLQAWDFRLLDDLFEILPVLLGSGGLIALAAALGAVIVVAGILAWREKPREPLRTRAAVLAGGVLTGGALYLLLSIGATMRTEALNDFFPLWNRQSYNSHYNKSGLCFALLRGSRHLFVNHPPDGYSAEAMDRIARTYPRTPEPTAPTADVIFYMVESLEDLAHYGLTYRTDPIPNFHALAKEHGGGRLIVPIYGGSTSNTEFEVLTGLSRIRPWPPDMVHAYRQWITDDTPALPWVFRDWGYRTAVISGATGKYFAQEAAYPRLGFHEFRPLGDRAGVPRKFDLVSDEAVVDEIIAILNGEDRSGTRRPCFLSVATDATHAPYHAERVPADERFALTDAESTQAVRDYAMSYGVALHHADRALGRLVAFLEARGRPAVLFVYGDHKPVMGAFFAAGVFRSDWPGALIDKYSTPLAVWSNLPSRPPAEPLFLSANFLSIELFSRLGVRHPPSTFHYTKQVYETFPIVSHVIGDREGNVHRPEDLHGAQADLIRDYGFVKYHTLVGSRSE